MELLLLDTAAAIAAAALSAASDRRLFQRLEKATAIAIYIYCYYRISNGGWVQIAQQLGFFLIYQNSSRISMPTA